MYTQFYGLREKPFSLSPDPRYLYLSDAHREALAHLLYGIEQGEGFIAVTGEVGTGKTTLCRTLLQRLEAGTEVAFIFNPQLSGPELLEAIDAELGLETEGRSRRELHEQLNRFLLTKKREDRRVLLIIDEAQTLNLEALEQVRLLSNLETDTEKLLQIILIGQPELDVMLDSPDLRQLLQRISVRWQLTPLGANETREYVRHRLRIAAGGPREIFSDLALREIHRRSGGIPRVVNLLCDRTLLAGYASGATSIGLGLVTQTERELRRGARTATLGRGEAATGGLTVPRWAAAVVLATLVAVGSFAWYLTRSPSTVVASPVRAALAPAAALPGREVAAPPPGRSLETLLTETADLPDPESGAAPTTKAAPPADLGTLLVRTSPAATTASALDAVLQAWGSPPVQAEFLSLGQALAALRAQGLAVLPLRGASADILRALDQPALLMLSALDGASRSVVLRRLGPDGEAELLGLGSGPSRLSFEEVARHWDGEAYVVWKDFEGLPPVIGPRTRGAPVAWLQHTLGRLGHFAGTPNGEFDLETVSAVRALQASSSLSIDGTVGPETKIHLYQAMGEHAVPRLGSGEGAASGPHTGPERS